MPLLNTLQIKKLSENDYEPYYHLQCANRLMIKISGATGIDVIWPDLGDILLLADQDVIVQYIVLRSDLWKNLGWPLGSIVAQACHAATAALWLHQDQPHSQTYCSDGNLDHMHKVIPLSMALVCVKHCC